MIQRHICVQIFLLTEAAPPATHQILMLKAHFKLYAPYVDHHFQDCVLTRIRLPYGRPNLRNGYYTSAEVGRGLQLISKRQYRNNFYELLMVLLCVFFLENVLQNQTLL